MGVIIFLGCSEVGVIIFLGRREMGVIIFLGHREVGSLKGVKVASTNTNRRY